MERDDGSGRFEVKKTRAKETTAHKRRRKRGIGLNAGSRVFSVMYLCSGVT